MTGESAPLAWLAAVLWPDGSVELAAAEPGEAATWWAAPSAADAHILIPASPTHARAAVQRYHDGRSWIDRARTLAVEVSARMGPAAAWLLGRHPVVKRGQARGVLEGLVDRFGADAEAVAVSLSRPKTNRKPVLQLISADATTFGFAKVGATPHIAALLRNEAEWLRRCAEATVVAPSVIDELTVAGHHVLVTSGSTGARIPRRGRTKCPLDLVRAVASLGTGERMKVATLPWAQGLRDVLTQATPPEREAVEATLARHGSVDVIAAAWHGDLTPWNVVRDHSGATLIDWEFAADGVPMGFDVCHFHTQVAMELEGLEPDAALAATWSRAVPDLVSLGVGTATVEVTLELYALELIRRTLALRAAGIDTTNVRQGEAALRALTTSATA